MAWEGSDRKERLPSNWTALVAEVKRRAGGQCEAIRSSGRRCTTQGRDCDHIVAGDNHDLSNLQLLCMWHHRAKSSAEGNAAQQVNRVKAKRPTKDHPGLK